MKEGIVCAPGVGVGRAGGALMDSAQRMGERAEMTRLKFRQLVCSGHHPGMQGLKIY